MADEDCFVQYAEALIMISGNFEFTDPNSRKYMAIGASASKDIKISNFETFGPPDWPTRDFPKPRKKKLCFARSAMRDWMMPVLAIGRSKVINNKLSHSARQTKERATSCYHLLNFSTFRNV